MEISEDKVELNPVQFCIFGHCDTGKSTLAGHLYKLVGGISDHDFDNIKQKCAKEGTLTQLYSRILDIYEEEQIKGKTHESYILEFDYPKGSSGMHKFQLIDTPGHKMFIRELINTLSAMETENIIGCLVISAKKGEFEAGWGNGTTKEDIIIARSLGINNILILVNKMDLIDWNKAIYDNIIKEVTPFIKNVCKFYFHKFIPISGQTGDNMFKFPKKYKLEWNILSKENIIYSFIDSLIATYYSMKLREEFLDPHIIIPTIQKSLNIAENPENQEENKEKKSINQFKAKIYVIQCENIITCGFECIIHYNGNEYNGMIEKIYGKKFIKTQETAACMIRMLNSEIRLTFKNKFLIRSGNLTIGYGLISKT
jgi:translation elongation factor EF-1alpha